MRFCHHVVRQAERYSRTLYAVGFGKDPLYLARVLLKEWGVGGGGNGKHSGKMLVKTIHPCFVTALVRKFFF